MGIACAAVPASAIVRWKLRMIGSPTPTVEPLTGLNVGGTNGGSPTNGAGVCPAAGPAGPAARAPGGGGTGAPGGGGGGARGPAGGGGASPPGGGGGAGSGSASAEPQAKVSTAVIPAAVSAATRGPLVHRDIYISLQSRLNPVCIAASPASGPAILIQSGRWPASGR